MKIAIVGFEDMEWERGPAWSLALEGMAVAENISVVAPEEADVLIIPRHRQNCFPSEGLWVALWVTGFDAGLSELMVLPNPPANLYHWDSPIKMDRSRKEFFALLRRICEDRTIRRLNIALEVIANLLSDDFQSNVLAAVQEREAAEQACLDVGLDQFDIAVIKQEFSRQRREEQDLDLGC